MHCGSIYGLTPPSYKSAHHESLRLESWSEYKELVKKWRNPDILLVNGDCVDGHQSKQYGAELLTTDTNVQCDIAVDCIKRWKAKKILMTYGTGYHTGNCEDTEYNIAKQLKATIEGRLFFRVEGMTIDARHKIGSSSLFHGRASSLLKEMAWNLIKCAEYEEPRANVIIRIHVHYHIWIEQPNKVLMTTPSLQISRGRYGSRECSGQTHWGAIRLTIDKGQIVGKDVICRKLVANKPSIIRI